MFSIGRLPVLGGVYWRARHLFSSGEWQDISASGGGGGAARVGAPVAAVGACRPPQLKSTSLGFARSAHFALHTQAKQIFRTPIQEFAAESSCGGGPVAASTKNARKETLAKLKHRWINALKTKAKKLHVNVKLPQLAKV